MISKLRPCLAMIFSSVFVLCLFAWNGPLCFAAEKEIPAELRQQWEEVKGSLDKEFQVCTEHCGADKGCLEKCKKAYESRLENKYQEMLLERKGKPTPKEGC